MLVAGYYYDLWKLKKKPDVLVTAKILKGIKKAVLKEQLF